jgi:RNA polymerase sigma-70 factor, ECF subfamily
MSDAKNTDDFVLLFTKDARWVFSYILMLVPNKADAEEVFQETSVTLWQKFGEFAAGSSFRAWALQVAYYKVLHYRARCKSSPLLLDDSVLEAIHGTAATMSEQLDDLHWALEKCRTKLTAEQRDLLDRRYGPNATTQSVAQDLGRSPRAVYRALDRIHQALYECIRREMSTEEPS